MKYWARVQETKPKKLDLEVTLARYTSFGARHVWFMCASLFYLLDTFVFVCILVIPHTFDHFLAILLSY